MNIAIAGLGLIGGSLAKAFSNLGDICVFGHDANKNTMKSAVASGAVKETLTPENLPLCDVVILALYPRDSIAWLENNAGYISETAVVTDCCGVKGYVCSEAWKIAEQRGFAFIGGHPMAGKQLSGFENADEGLFCGAPMILVPGGCPEKHIDLLRALYLRIGFGRIVLTTPDEHDRVIAFSSQLAHVVSNAFVKSPAALSHAGFSAGSYRDLTRVAYLNENMWAELFMLNAGALIGEIDFLVKSLAEYRDTLESGGEEKLRKLLLEGKLRKTELDGDL